MSEFKKEYEPTLDSLYRKYSEAVYAVARADETLTAAKETTRKALEAYTSALVAVDKEVSNGE